MGNVKGLPDVFTKDTKVGDEMIIVGSHVRIDSIELVVHTTILDNSKPDQSEITVSIPMTDDKKPFHYKQ